MAFIPVDREILHNLSRVELPHARAPREGPQGLPDALVELRRPLVSTRPNLNRPVAAAHAGPVDYRMRVVGPRAIRSVPSRLCDKSGTPTFARSEVSYPSTTPFPRRCRLDFDVATPPRPASRRPKTVVSCTTTTVHRGPARHTSDSSTSTPSCRAVRRPEHQATRRTRTAPRRLTHNRTTAARAGTVATMTALRQLAPAASRRRLVPSTLSHRTIIPSTSSRRHAQDRPERPTSSASRTTADHN